MNIWNVTAPGQYVTVHETSGLQCAQKLASPRPASMISSAARSRAGHRRRCTTSKARPRAGRSDSPRVGLRNCQRQTLAHCFIDDISPFHTIDLGLETSCSVLELIPHVPVLRRKSGISRGCGHVLPLGTSPPLLRYPTFIIKGGYGRLAHQSY